MSDAIADAVFKGSVVVVETAATPPISIDLGGDPSPLTKALRPRVTLVRNGITVFSSAPYGDPSEHRTYVFVALAVLAGLVLIALTL